MVRNDKGKPTRDLNLFRSDIDYLVSQRFQIFLWVLIQHFFFSKFFLPRKFRPFLLRLAGAKIGEGVIIKSGVKIHLPFNLEVGDHTWIGENSWILNHAKVRIGSNVCISQRVVICSSSHEYESKSLDYAHAPIQIHNGAWICLDAKVLPGVTIGECSVVSAGEIVRRALPDYSMLVGGQIRAIEPPR